MIHPALRVSVCTDSITAERTNGKTTAPRRHGLASRRHIGTPRAVMHPARTVSSGLAVVIQS